MSQSQSVYAMCWRDDKLLFEWAATWPEARLLLDARIGDGSSEERVAGLIRHCSRFLYDEPVCVGFGPDPKRRWPGVYRAIRVCPDREPTVLAVSRRPGGLLVIAGPSEELKNRLGPTRPAERYVLAQAVAEGERRPPSIARETMSAKRAMDVILAGAGNREHLLERELGELIWFAQRGRRLRRDSPSIRLNQAVSEAVAIALSRQRSTETLNLRAAELRDAHALEASRQISLESIALCDSAEHNPYGYGGLAATLRRMRLYEEADAAVKKALKPSPTRSRCCRCARRSCATTATTKTRVPPSQNKSSDRRVPGPRLPGASRDDRADEEARKTTALAPDAAALGSAHRPQTASRPRASSNLAILGRYPRIRSPYPRVCDHRPADM